MYIIITLTIIIGLNALLINFYLDKKTRFKNDYEHEPSNIQLYMSLLAFVLILFKKHLKYIREINYYEDRLKYYKICIPVYTGYKGDDLFDKKIKDIERYLKLRKLQHKSNKFKIRIR